MSLVSPRAKLPSGHHGTDFSVLHSGIEKYRRPAYAGPKYIIMKKYFLSAALAAILFACNDTADNNATVGKDSANNNTNNTNSTAGTAAYTPSEGDVRRRGGEIEVWRNGTWVRSDEDVTLDDGITVRRNGRVVRNNEEYEIEDGAVVTKTGRFIDKAGNAIEDGWEGVKKGWKNAKEEVKDALKDDKKKTDN